MATPTKQCPKCGALMRSYAVADSAEDWHWTQYLGFEVVTVVGTLILAGLLVGLGEKGWIVAIIVAPFVTLAIFWRSIASGGKRAVAERGRYYCSACWQHFEGDALRQITQ